MAAITDRAAGGASAPRRAPFRITVASALLLLPPLISGAAGAQVMIEAFITHRGYEQIIAGPAVPGTLGLATDPDFVAADVALNAAGTRVWFVLFDWGANPEYQVWTMLTNGTGAQQITLTTDNWTGSVTGLTNLFVNTNEDGNIAVLDSSDKYSRIELSDPLPVAAEQMFVLSPFGFSSGKVRLSNLGTSALFLDEWNDQVMRMDLLALNPTPILVADKSAFGHQAKTARSLRGLDITGNGTEFWVAAEQYYSDVLRSRFWVTHGSGLPTPALQEETPPEGDNLDIRQVEVSDNGQQLVYCPEHHTTLNNPRHCFFQQAGSSQYTEILDGTRPLGAPLLANDGGVVYLLSDVNIDNPYGFRTRTDNPDWRLVAGTQRLSGKPDPAFRNAKLSYDGSVIAAPAPGGVYIQHDGWAAPPHFPFLEHILTGYDSSTDELVVQVEVSSLSTAGIERIYTLPLFRGIEPTRSLTEPNNPLFNDRQGGGVFFTTTFTNTGGRFWERRIPMGGKHDLLTSDFSLRIVVVDDSGTLTSYYDVTPTMLFGDGFETGDLSRWSSSTAP